MYFISIMLTLVFHTKFWEKNFQAGENVLKFVFENFLIFLGVRVKAIFWL